MGNSECQVKKPKGSRKDGADGAGLSEEAMFDLRSGGKKSVLTRNAGRAFQAEAAASAKALRWE